MKGIKIICLLMMLLGSTFAQGRYFFYVRYDPAAGNSSAIVNWIDSVVNLHPLQFAVMLSGGSQPQVADENTWPDIRQKLLTQQSAPNVYADVEEQRLNELFAQLLSEHVKERNGTFKIIGENDYDWVVTFILSKSMYENEIEMEVVPLEFVQINQLEERDIIIHWMFYDSDIKLHECRNVPEHNLYSHKWSIYIK